MRILLVGHGKMGRLVESLAPEYGCDVAGVIDPQSAAHGGGPDAPRWSGVDVAIDFSTGASVPVNVPILARRGINLVVGTTGWREHEPGVRKVIEESGAGIVAGSVPEREFEETEHKAAALRRAIDLAAGIEARPAGAGADGREAVEEPVTAGSRA